MASKNWHVFLEELPEVLAPICLNMPLIYFPWLDCFPWWPGPPTSEGFLSGWPSLLPSAHICFHLFGQGYKNIFMASLQPFLRLYNVKQRLFPRTTLFQITEKPNHSNLHPTQVLTMAFSIRFCIRTNSSTLSHKVFSLHHMDRVSTAVTEVSYQVLEGWEKGICDYSISDQFLHRKWDQGCQAENWDCPAPLNQLLDCIQYSLAQNCFS